MDHRIQFESIDEAEHRQTVTSFNEDNNNNPLAVVDDSIPKEKSGVELDNDAPQFARRYGKGDQVHMAVVENGVRRKKVFTIIGVQVSRSRTYWEYKLVDARGSTDNEWYRENKLGLERRAR